MFFFSIGSVASTDHLGFESQLLEIAIRTNDVTKVKQFLVIHRDKFQVRTSLLLFFFLLSIALTVLHFGRSVLNIYRKKIEF